MESTVVPVMEGRPVEHPEDVYTDVLRSASKLLTGHRRRLFEAEVCQRLCDGNARVAERRFGWGRDTVAKGTRERQAGVRCLDNFRARGRRRAEDANRQLAADIRSIAEPKSYADPELKSSRRYCTMSAGEVREALRAKGYEGAALPSERSMRDVLNRMNFRLKRVRKGRPLRKTAETDAIFANVNAARAQARGDPNTLEISMDTKAKVGVGDYVRGGKMPVG